MTECHKLGNLLAAEEHFGSWPQKLGSPESGKLHLAKGLLLCHPVEDQEKREQGKGGGKALSWAFVQRPYGLTLDKISCIPGLPHAHHTTQDHLELRVLLPQPPMCCDCRHVSLHLVTQFMCFWGTKPRASQALSAERHHKPLVISAKSQLSMLLHWGFNLQLMNPNRPLTPEYLLFLFSCYF